ncbi:MAG: hypothetical protein ACYC2R_05915 [Burkholderiales bacterium]
MSHFVTSMEVAAATGAFDAVIYDDRGDRFVGFYVNQRKVCFFFDYAKNFRAGSQEVDNTVHLSPEMYQQLQETNPELLEKMAHSRPLEFIEDSPGRSLLSDGMGAQFVYNLDGDKLAAAQPLGDTLYHELKKVAEGFMETWLWLGDDHSDAAEKNRRESEKQEWHEYAVNLKPALRSQMRLVGGVEDGTVSRYVLGPDTSQFNTDNADEYNILNLQVEIRHAAQNVFERWH